MGKRCRAAARQQIRWRRLFFTAVYPAFFQAVFQTFLEAVFQAVLQRLRFLFQYLNRKGGCC